MPTYPPLKNVNAFIDGQNLYHDVRESFGYTCPNYDVISFPPGQKRQRMRHKIQKRKFGLKKIYQE
ncbi:MAG: hypothetical protein KKH04_00065 [Proteobacteria bacterium]|nr:hypothetical protein [Pseudomonadota bacterium]